MNILLISAVFPPEPVVSSKLSEDIAKATSKLNEVTVLSPRPTRPMGFVFNKKQKFSTFQHCQLETFTCPSSSLIGRFIESYSFGKHCAKYIKDNNKDIDIIYANTWPLLAQFLSVKAAYKYKTPIIIHVQDIYPESLTSKIQFAGNIINIFLLLIDKYTLRKSTSVIAISEKMKEYLCRSRKIEPSKVSVVENWQDEDAFVKYDSMQETNKIDKTSLTFMYLGNIGPVAGIELLIDAFVKADIKNSRLVIAGAGSMKENLIKYAKVYDKCYIEFWSVPDGKVPEIQSKANILLLPIKKGSAANSIPSKLPAYMFSKKPIIASVDYDSDTAEAVRNSKCGWVITPESVDELSKLMQEVAAKNNDELLAIGNKGFDYALEHFSKQGNLPKLVKIIEDTAKV